MTVLQITGAIVIGLGLGYVMQRPQICYNRAYRSLTWQGDSTMLRALGLGMLIQMVGFYALLSLGLVQLNIVPGWWLSAIIGGFFFGLAFVFAQGCSTTMWYRVGSGNVGSMIVLISFAIAEVITFNGPLSPVREALNRYEIVAANGQPATLPNLFGLSHWWFVIPLALVGGLWLWQAARQEGSPGRIAGWSWPLIGLLLGVLGTLAWLFSQGTDWAYGVGIVGATGPILRALWEGPDVLNWGSVMVLALPVGSFIAAWHRGELSWTIPDWKAAIRYAISGLVMGLSASIASGCNIGHTFTGAPTLAVSSLIASITIFVGALVGNWIRFGLQKNPLPALRVQRG